MNIVTTVRQWITGLSPSERRSTTRVVLWLPERDARAENPDKIYFDRHRRALMKAGQFVCTMREPHAGPIELHHMLPAALKNGVDLAQLNGRYNLTLTEETFRVWYQTENCVPLCDTHHTLIHALYVPEWLALQVWRSDLPLPIRLEKTSK